MDIRTSFSTIVLVLLFVNLLICGVLAMPLDDSYLDETYSIDSDFDVGDDYEYDIEDYGDEESKFPCLGEGYAIELSLLCDNHTDCPDGSDEVKETCMLYRKEEGADAAAYVLPPLVKPTNDFDVDYESCSEDEFQCPLTLGLCVPKSSKCDGESDCPDGEDELNCGKTQAVPANFPYMIEKDSFKEETDLRMPKSHSDSMLGHLVSHKQWQATTGNKNQSEDLLPFVTESTTQQSRHETKSFSRTTSTQQPPHIPSSSAKLFPANKPVAYTISTTLSAPILKFHKKPVVYKYVHQTEARKIAGLEQVFRFRDLKDEEPVKTRTGESGETIASDHFIDPNKMTDMEVEQFLQNYASLTGSERIETSRKQSNDASTIAADEISKKIPTTFSTVTPSSPTASLVTLPSQTLEISKTPYVKPKRSHNRKKIKGLLSQLIRHVGKRITSNIDDYDLNLNISIRKRRQHLENGQNPESGSNPNKEPYLSLSLEVNV